MALGAKLVPVYMDWKSVTCLTRKVQNSCVCVSFRCWNSFSL